MFKLAKLAFQLAASDADSLHFLCCVPLLLLELHVFTHGYILNRLININSLSLTLKDATRCSITYTIVRISLQQVISQILLGLSEPAYFKEEVKIWSYETMIVLLYLHVCSNGKNTINNWVDSSLVNSDSFRLKEKHGTLNDFVQCVEALTGNMINNQLTANFLEYPVN